MTSKGPFQPKAFYDSMILMKKFVIFYTLSLTLYLYLFQIYLLDTDVYT